MKLRIFSILISITAAFLLTGTACGLGFQEEISITIPNNGQSVNDFTICDIDYDGIPEVLYRSGNNVTLYSSSLDSILFETTCDSNAYDINILLGDVNRDSIADIGIATYFPITDYSDSVVLVKIYDGASDYKDSVSSYFSNLELIPNELAMWYGYSLTYGITSFETLDIDSDGYNELIFSYGNTASYAIYAARFTETSNGALHIYNSFPDSVINYKRTHPVNDLQLISIQEPRTTLLAMQHTRYYYYDDLFGPGYTYLLNHNSVELFEANTSTSLNYDDSLVPYGSFDFSTSCKSKIICTGDLTGNRSSTEMLTNMSWHTRWPSSDGQWSGTSGNGSFLYRISWPNSIEQIGNYRSGFSNGIYLDQYPGTFFAFRYGEFGQYRGDDGVAIQTTSEYPTNKGEWVIFHGNKYYLTRNGFDVKLYSVQIATDVTELEDLSLPNQFSLGKPYPNPFNATQTIPITVMPGREVKVELYNLLGQKIETLYSGRSQSSEMEISWSVEHIASGVYFIKATSGRYSDVVKTILLK